MGGRDGRPFFFPGADGTFVSHFAAREGEFVSTQMTRKLAEKAEGSARDMLQRHWTPS